MAVLHFSGPQRAGLLHADPHPGNFRLLPDGRLGVIDFGAVARLPDGRARADRAAGRLALEGDGPRTCSPACAPRASCKPTIEVDAEGVLDYLLPFLEPVAVPTFRFTRAWMRAQAARIGDPRSDASRLGRQLNLPPAYLLIHRVTLGSIGVLCQLDGEAPYRGVCEEWLPGFAAVREHVVVLPDDTAARCRPGRRLSRWVRPGREPAAPRPGRTAADAATRSLDRHQTAELARAARCDARSARRAQRRALTSRRARAACVGLGHPAVHVGAGQVLLDQVHVVSSGGAAPSGGAGWRCIG